MRRGLFIFIIFFSAIGISQPFKVGDNNCTNVPIAYQFPCQFGKDTTYSYALDLDGDLVNDCKVDFKWKYGSPYWYNLQGLYFTNLNSSTYLSFNGTGCSTVSLLKNHTVGNVINNSLTWNQGTGAMSYVYYIGTSTQTTCGAPNNYYVAYKKITPGDTVWGWITGLFYCNPSTGQGPYIGALAYKSNLNPCTGIDEYNKVESNYSVFPNPNNGEFEIKGMNEETIFISNELGQQIEEKHLNSENNYSVKINDLQNGVYFVGRQKIVVIR